MKSPKMKFETKVISGGPKGAWTFIRVPFSVQEAFGSKALVRVTGTINGFAFRNSLMPEGNGMHRMNVGKEMQADATVRPGDIVKMVLERDDKERTVDVPAELKAALKKNKAAGIFFESLTASCKKEYADWIAGAKQQATKMSRSQKAIELLLEKKKRIR
jgi:hypothetical protein